LKLPSCRNPPVVTRIAGRTLAASS
jgi:hypothetical protein